MSTISVFIYIDCIEKFIKSQGDFFKIEFDHKNKQFSFVLTFEDEEVAFEYDTFEDIKKNIPNMIQCIREKYRNRFHENYNKSTKR